MIHMKFECVPRFKLGVKSDLKGGGCLDFPRASRNREGGGWGWGEIVWTRLKKKKKKKGVG